MSVWTLFKTLVAGAILATLTACAYTGPLRPGETTAAEIPSRTLPVGKRYAYTMEIEGLPLSIGLSFVSSRMNEDQMRFDGEATMQVTDATLAEALAAGAAISGGAAPEIADGTVRTKIFLITDNRGRSITGSVFGSTLRYQPHDCFATLGRCTYAATEDGERTHFIVETTESGGIWTSVTVGDPRKSPEATGTVTTRYTLDADGFLKDGDYRFSESGATLNMNIRRTN